MATQEATTVARARVDSVARVDRRAETKEVVKGVVEAGKATGVEAAAGVALALVDRANLAGLEATVVQAVEAAEAVEENTEFFWLTRSETASL